MGLTMRRTVIAAAAAAGIGITAGACGSPAHHGGQLSGDAGGRTWTIGSCQVDVTYISDTNPADYYVPDSDANFRQYFVPNQASGAAGMAVVITFVNNTGGQASLPTGLFVSFTDRNGNSVGNPQRFNSPYGSAVTNGLRSGETFSSSTLFSPGQTVTESPDLGASVPPQSDLSCSVS